MASVTRAGPHQLTRGAQGRTFEPIEGEDGVVVPLAIAGSVKHDEGPLRVGEPDRTALLELPQCIRIGGAPLCSLQYVGRAGHVLGAHDQVDPIRGAQSCVAVEAEEEGAARDEEIHGSLLERRGEQADARQQKLVVRPGVPIETFQPVEQPIGCAPAFEPPVKKRHQGERPGLEVVEVQPRSQRRPRASRFPLGAVDDPKNSLLGRRGPERNRASPVGAVAQAGEVSGSCSAAARRRSSDAFSTWRYCDRESRSRRPLFCVCSRRSSRTEGRRCMLSLASSARAYQSTVTPTRTVVENRPTRKNDSRRISIRFGAIHGASSVGLRRRAVSLEASSGLRNSRTCPKTASTDGSRCRTSTCRPILSGMNRSSASRNAKYAPCASSAARFRAAPFPPRSWRSYRTALPNVSITEAVPSSDPSSTTISSIGR